MDHISDGRIAEFIEACHATERYGLVLCSSGNFSARLDADRMLVTASRSWLGRLTRDQVSVCHIKDGQLLDGPKPTVEIGIHAGILRERPDIGTVLHFQSPCATTLACRPEMEPDYFVIPEIPYYIGPVGHVPYGTPGSAEFAQTVVEAAREHDVVVVANHGMVAVGRDLDGVLQNAVFFELACRIILHGGERVRPLDPESAGELLALRSASGKSAV